MATSSVRMVKGQKQWLRASLPGVAWCVSAVHHRLQSAETSFPLLPRMSSHTFLWHDYETFGANTRRDRPAQFAAIRTDAELNEIGEPVMLYCKPANDYLPDPQSCLITGITPQVAWERGVPEREFAARIETEMAQPGTIGGATTPSGSTMRSRASCSGAT